MIELTVLNDNNVDLNTVDDGLIGLDVVMATGGGSEIRNQDKTVVPTESEQSVTADAGYTGLGTVTVDGIDPDYVGSGITRRTSDDLTAVAFNVVVPKGYYDSNATKSVVRVEQGVPVATKSSVTNHSVNVTPSVLNQTGWITVTPNIQNPTGTIYGDAVSVSASELVSGTKNITISANGTTTEDVTNYASASITANVPNSYSASDEGKVVSSGALVAQTSDTVTANDTYDTTLINSLTVNVSGSAGYTTGTFTPASNTGSVTINTGLNTVHGVLIFPTQNPNTNYSNTLALYSVWVDAYDPQWIKVQAVRRQGTTRYFENWTSASPPYTLNNGVITITFGYPETTGYFVPLIYKWYAW